MNVCVYTHTYVCIFTYICISYTHICMYIYIHLHLSQAQAKDGRGKEVTARVTSERSGSGGVAQEGADRQEGVRLLLTAWKSCHPAGPPLLIRYVYLYGFMYVWSLSLSADCLEVLPSCGPTSLDQACMDVCMVSISHSLLTV